MRNGQLPALLEHLRQWATPEANGLSDAQLLARFRTDQDRDVFATLIQRHGQMVWRVCRNVLRQEQDAEDAFQATFLVLAQNVASIREASALAGWLHGTACRIARRARRDAATRRTHEHKRASMPPTQVRDESVWREILAILDDEVQRLSSRQRAVFVLCSLEGKSLAEAAAGLGWKAGTVSVTLSRARQQLRRRLARRGVELSAVLAGLALATESAPAALVERTLHTALALAAGKLSARLVSASVASLVRQASQAFAGTKLHLVVFLLASSVIAAGVTSFAWQKSADNHETVAASPPQRTDAVKSERLDRFGDALPAGAVARIGSVRWWHGPGHGPLVYTPDGKSLVFGDHRGMVHVMDAATGQELRRIDLPHDKVPCFALTPDGKTLATAGVGSSVIRLWDVQTGQELRQIEGDKRGIAALAFSLDGKSLALGWYEDIRLFDTTTWKEIARIPVKEIGSYDALFFLPDGKTLIAKDHITISWWDIPARRIIRRITRKSYGKPGGFYHFAVAPDGKRLAAIHSSNLLFLWDAATGREIRAIALGRRYAGSCLCFSPDGQTLACGSAAGREGNQTVFYAAATGEELRRWNEGDNPATQLAFAPDGKIMAQVVAGVIRLREIKTGKLLAPDSGLPDGCLAVRFGRDGKTVIAGCRNGRIGTWNALTGEPLSPLRDPPKSFGHPSRMLLGPALTAHGEKAALVNADGVLHVWEPATGKVCCRIAEPPVGEDQADFSADGKWVAIKHKDNLIRLWDATSGKLIKTLDHPAHYGFPHPHAFSPEGRTLALGPIFPDTGVIRLCAMATGKEEGHFTWRDHTKPTCLLFSVDGKYLIAVNERDQTPSGDRPRGGEGTDALRLWSRESGREVRSFPVPGGDIRALALSPDGKTLAAAVNDTIFLWELASGAERGRFRGHRQWIWSLAFSPDGRLLASGSRDYTACVWDMTGICPDGKWSFQRLKAEQLQRLWTELGHKDGIRAYRALWSLAAAGPDAVALMARHLRPTPCVEEKRVKQLIADLDSEGFQTRDRATQELQRLGERVEPALRKALAARPSLEVAQRLRALLEQVESRTLSAEQLQALRAVEVLEHIGSAEAQAVLCSLAAGAPGDRLTEEANAARKRLAASAKREP